MNLMNSKPIIIACDHGCRAGPRLGKKLSRSSPAAFQSEVSVKNKSFITLYTA